MGERYILHVDMDAFFAAVEQRDDPSLRGKPVIVGADPKGGKGRGVVSTCSYEARKFGVRSAMPISEAWRRCPRSVFMTPDFGRYSAASEIIHGIFYDFTPDIEPISIDEAFLDITNSYKLFGSPLDVARLIKARIRAETGLTASVGLAPTKMAAKIASDLQKPDGLVEVKSGQVREFLKPLDIGRIWGLGPKTANVMREHGIHTIGQLAQTGVPELYAAFKRGPKKVRLLGVKVSGLIPAGLRESLFEEETDKKEGVHRAVEAIRRKFGRGAIYRAGGKKDV